MKTKSIQSNPQKFDSFIDKIKISVDYTDSTWNSKSQDLELIKNSLHNLQTVNQVPSNLFWLHNKDCLSLMKKIPNNSIDLILTDVPFGVNFKWNYCDSPSYVFSVYNDWLKGMFESLKDWAHCYIFVPTLELDKWISAAKLVWFTLKNILSTRSYTSNCFIPNNFKFDTQLILFLSKWKAKDLNKVNWVRTSQSWFNDKRNTNPNPFTFSYPSFIDVFANKKANRVSKNIHWNEKNVLFCEILIKLSSNPWDIVFDPFVWSGTTAIAAIKQNRNYIATDNNKDNYKLAKQNIKNLKN